MFRQTSRHLRSVCILSLLLLLLNSSIASHALAARGSAAQQVPAVVNYYLGENPWQWGAAQPMASEPALLYSTFLGGNGNDMARRMALDAQGNIYIIGRTDSVDFIGTSQRPAGKDDVVVIKLDPTGKQIRYITLVGGRGVDDGIALAVTPGGEVWATVQPDAGFPFTHTLFPGQASSSDAALIRLSSTGQLNYSARLNLANFESDVGRNIGLDTTGNIYITGRNINTFTTPLLKIDPTGSRVLWERSFGERMQSVALAVGPDQRVYMTGYVDWGSVPVTADALQPTCNRLIRAPETCSQDAYLLVVDGEGDVQYASYFGGSNLDRPESIAVDSSGAIYLGGQTYSKDFPVRNPIQAQCPSGLADEEDGCYFFEGYVAKLSSDGQDVVYGTYLDATVRSSDSSIVGIATDAHGNAYLTGRVDGDDFPLKDPVQPEFGRGLCDFSSLCYDAFVSKLDPNGALVYSTYLGDQNSEYPYDIAINAMGDAFVTGSTLSPRFPITEDAIKPEWGIEEDLYLARIGPAPAQLPTTTATTVPTTAMPATATATAPATTITATATAPATTVTATATAPATTVTPTATTPVTTTTATETTPAITVTPTATTPSQQRFRVYLPLVQR